ncbi:hypothetical protein ACFXOY_18080 [Streptomyces niveus]|uniref:hypothetical protein n=1 Tax=Streptomyces niveus TaxID=193462 RepID=UPI00368C1BDB
MDFNAEQAVALQPHIVQLRRQIDAGQPWSGPSDLSEDTLQAVATGAANTYELSALVVAFDRADSSTDFLRKLLAVAFAHGFNTATSRNAG